MPPRKVCEIINESHSPTLQPQPPKGGAPPVQFRTRGADFSCILCRPVSSPKNAGMSHRLDHSSFAIRTFHRSVCKHASSWRHSSLFCGDSITYSRVLLVGIYGISILHASYRKETFGVCIFVCSTVISVTWTPKFNFLGQSIVCTFNWDASNHDTLKKCGAHLYACQWHVKAPCPTILVYYWFFVILWAIEVFDWCLLCIYLILSDVHDLCVSLLSMALFPAKTSGINRIFYGWSDHY